MISTETFNTLQGFPGPLLIFSPLFLVVLGFLVLFVNSLKAGLSHVPGPFLARYTDAWNLWCAWKITKYGGKNEHFRQLQAKYGDTVRIGPQSVLVLDPAAVPVVYGVRAKLDKVCFTRLISKLRRITHVAVVGSCIPTISPTWCDDESDEHSR